MQKKATELQMLVQHLDAHSILKWIFFFLNMHVRTLTENAWS